MRLPVIVVVFLYLVLILTDLWIVRDFFVMSLYDKFRPIKKKTGKWWIVYSVFSVLVLALLTVTLCMPRQSEDAGITAIMWMLYTVFSVVIAQLVYCIFSLLGLLPCMFGGKRWNTGLWIGLPLGALFFTMIWWGATVGRNQIEVQHVEISSPRLPAGFDGYKIAQISDLHVGTWGSDTAFVSRLVESVNDLNPDLIVFTGDIVNRESSELIPFMKPLSRLSAPDGVLTILGNHDYGDYVRWKRPETKKANLDSLKSYQRQIGWKMLNNSHRSILKENGDSIIIIGVENWGEPPFTQYGDLKKAYPEKNFNDNNFKVLLSHNPEHWNREVSRISNVDLTLSGHTHAMQIMFSLGKHRWSPSKFRYEQWGGLYSKPNAKGDTTSLYVNIGAGEVGIPMRIGADPEITLITLKK